MFALAWRRQLNPVVIVFAGLVINLYLAAISMGLLLFFQEELKGLLVWGSGSLVQNSWSGVSYLLPRLLAAAVLAAVLVRPLAVLELDDASARSLGVSLQHLRLAGLGLAVFVTACVVSVVGLIGFIGLAAPAMVRLLGIRQLGQRLLWAPILGALLLAATDLLLQSLSRFWPVLIPTGAMTALLKDALDPNLVQTLENNPAIIHGGPFANIAHGCNSVMATKLSLSLADYVITEAGFGADLGAEKFLDIKCRYAGIAPSACVLVATLRALKSHGGVAKADLNTPNLEAVKKGAANLVRHIDNMKNGFGLPVVVAINAFPTDTAEEQAYVEQVCAEQGVPCVLSEVFAKGGEGGKALAEKVLDIMEDRPIQYTYPLEMPLKDKINAIATKIYRADGVNYSAAASKTLAELTELGYGDLPVCIAKTQYSFSDNAKLTGAPTGFTMEVREVRLAAGAGFVVVICGSIMTMPGLPKKPAAVGIDVDADGKITGLF